MERSERRRRRRRRLADVSTCECELKRPQHSPARGSADSSAHLRGSRKRFAKEGAATAEGGERLDDVVAHRDEGPSPPPPPPPSTSTHEGGSGVGEGRRGGVDHRPAARAKWAAWWPSRTPPSRSSANGLNQSSADRRPAFAASVNVMVPVMRDEERISRLEQRDAAAAAQLGRRRRVGPLDVRLRPAVVGVVGGEGPQPFRIRRKE